MIAVYLKADRLVEIEKPGVVVSDIAKVYCRSTEIAKEICNVPIFTFHMEDNGKKKVFSILYVIEKITEYLKSEDIVICNIGTEDIVMQLSFTKKYSKQSAWWKIASVVIITFLGSAFSIMTYNEDVDTMGVFEKIAEITGMTEMGMQFMIGAYALGIGLGVIIFFNHFGRHKITGDPTPMEVEMEKYESDVTDTWVQKESRKGQSIDVT